MDDEQPNPNLKTSPEWVAVVSDGVKIVEPTGWDQDNYQYSWNEERITMDEFYRRRSASVTDFTDYKPAGS